MTLTTRLIFTLLCWNLLLTGCSEPKTAGPSLRPVRVTAVHFQQGTTTSHYSGEIRARHEAPLSFQVGGRIVKRAVDIGASVKQGQLLATLDPADYRLGEAGAEAQLAAAQAELAQARKDVGHLDALRAQNLASPAAVDRRQDLLRAAEAKVAAAKANLGSQSRQSGYTELRAEHDGVITTAEAESGQVIAPGQAIFRLARTAELEAVFSVPENRLDALRAATSLRVALWADPQHPYRGRLREVSPGVDAVLRTFTAKVTLLDADSQVRLGMTATAFVEQAEPRPVAWLPLTALIQDRGNPTVWVFDPAVGAVHPRAVSFAAYDQDSIKLLDGVREGEQVVTAGVHKLVAGEKVRLQDGTAP